MQIKLITRLLVFIFLFCFSINANSQDEGESVYKNAVTFGIIHSLNITSLAGTMPVYSLGNISKTTSLVSPRYTMDFGMTVDYYLSKKISLQFDLVYTYMGSRFLQKQVVYNEIGKISTSNNVTYAMDYFKLPLTANYYLNEKLYFLGGAYISTLVSSKKYNYWSEYDKEPIENVNLFDYGIVFGTGFNMNLFKLGFQYSYGLSKVINAPDNNLHNNVFQIVMRWKFYSDLRK